MEQAARYADMFAAMGTESRLRIMQLLLSAHPDGMVVGEIQEELGVSASNLSHHLDKLKNEELVTVRREGTFLRCTANAPSICANPAAIPAIHSSIRTSLPSMPCAGTGTGVVRPAAACRAATAPPAGTAVAAVARNTIPTSAGSTALAALTRNAGSATVNNGSATSAAAEAVHTMWRAPAERLRRSHAISHAATSTSVLLSAALARIGHADAVQFNILSSLFLGLLDHCRHAVQFLPRQPRGGDVQKRRHNLFRAPVEKCLHHVFHRAPLGLVARHHRHIHVLQPLGLMLDVALLFQHPQHGPHRRVPRRRLHGFPHFRRRPFRSQERR